MSQARWAHHRSCAPAAGSDLKELYIRSPIISFVEIYYNFHLKIKSSPTDSMISRRGLQRKDQMLESTKFTNEVCTVVTY